MRIHLTLVDPRSEAGQDVFLEAADAAPTGAVIRALLDTLDLPDLPAECCFHRGEPLDPEMPVAGSGLKEGSLIAVGDPDHSDLDEPAGLVEVRVVSGPGSGTVHRLAPGHVSVGSGAGRVIALADDRIPSTCASVVVTYDGATTLRAVGDSAEALAETGPHVEPVLALDRVALTGRDTEWTRGAQLRIGEVLLELEAVEAPDAAVEDSAEAGWLDYNRPPRLLAPERVTDFRLPSLPREGQGRGLPWLVMLLPLVVAVAMALALARPTYLMMGLFSPLMMLGNHLQGRRQGKRSFRQQTVEFKDRTARIEADVEQALVEERLARRLAAPDPALALLIATGPRGRLWERRTTDPDYLSVRLGVGDLESEVTVEDPEQLEHRRRTNRAAYDVPVTVPLRERGVIGIAAPDGLQRRMGCWAVAQLAVSQSPRDTQVYVLTDAAGAPDWGWLRWLPHARPQLGQDTVVTIGTDVETCARRVAELSAILSARKRAAGDKERGTRRPPDIVVVLDGARRLRSLPGVVALLKHGPALGIYSLCLDSEERLLPEEASAVVLGTARGLSLRQMRVTVVEEVTADLVDGPWLQRTARALAAIRDISDGDGDSVLPATCRLTEVLGLEPLGPDQILARWAIAPRSTSATLGISLDGPFSVDLDTDGPHGLVAGTTGAGKSELLQSLVASLAVSNRPDAMNFVLVDYKGGAAFQDCADLPHTVGMVTDLDPYLVERALVSLGAEVTRREHILATAEAKDIGDYLDLEARSKDLPPLPRLLIVIDEFAAMARELPDFIPGLVDIAQRGRSLGIHLILATQRPGGVVSPEIRANTNLRIALRVTDTSESQDVMGAPDAALISESTPGRAYVRLGAGTLVPFQCGRVGGRRPGAVAAAAPPPWSAEMTLADLPRPPPGPSPGEVVDDAEVTDLKVLVRAVCVADERLGATPRHSPWLSALSTEVLLARLVAEVDVPESPAIARIPYAVEDLPAQQRQQAAHIDFEHFSHLSILGGPRSGRSQALRTIAGAVAQLTSPADVHLHGLDCGNGALLPLAGLPHCGAVVRRTQEDRALRLLTRLQAELNHRQEVLAAGGFASLTELRARVQESERLPHIVLLLDGWEGFVGGLAEVDAGAPYELVQTLLREGASVGIHLIITGDKQLVNVRMGSLIEHKIGLRIPDRTDFSLIGLSPRKLPANLPDGRGFRSGSGIELQFAVLTEDTSGHAQAEELRRLGAAAAERHAGLPGSKRPFRVDVLPGRIGFDEAWELRGMTRTRPLWALVGVGGDELGVIGLDLARTNTAVVAGPSRSGRSTALLGIAESLLRGGTEIVIAAPRPSPLRRLEGRDGVRGVLTGVEITTEELEFLMEPTTPVVLLVDDGELLREVGCRDLLRMLVRTGGDRGQAIVLGGDSAEIGGGFSGWQVDVKGRQGVLLSPQGITEGELIGVRIPRSATGSQARAGRALVNAGDGRLRTVRVPLPD